MTGERGGQGVLDPAGATLVRVLDPHTILPADARYDFFLTSVFPLYGDLNGDGVVDGLDLVWFSTVWYHPRTSSILTRDADLFGDSNERIDDRDLLELIRQRLRRP